ncbi:thiamine-phosphate kinase [Aliiglaciecola lipolytica]|uniref:Thiamine-monophosphate kinase n=1 Tax=Aliiglaciecola lipolytica E3 TaxID=1127673 RepID=K6YCI7_9ALTE|nr:thiamine-phosphate kinase [Aliiglaciecola lipolytica]GAC15902.1 thiamine-monophosphate kinase [Aliiglaciecola lipolytica E3]
MKEFDIIERFFKQERESRKDVLQGIGDDCAITRVPEGLNLAITTDTLISGVHFPVDTPPEAIAHKALAVNLSDLAAMGAEPAWFSLSLSLPEVDENWLEAFSQSLFEVSEYYSIQLIGGDTVQGPLAITITAQGFVPNEKALVRSGAKPGDLVYVTGTLGDAGAGLDIKLGKLTSSEHGANFLLNRLNYPAPRLLAGTALRRTASACIDISDGLIQDLQHILNASECGAKIQVKNLPLSVALKETVDLEQAYQYALSSGDDYELLFTVNEEQKGILETSLANANMKATCIGQLTGVKRKLELVFDDEPYQQQGACFEHFSA